MVVIFFFFRTEGADFGAVSLYLHQHALLVPAKHCSDTFTEIPLSYVMTNKPSSACVIYHSMCWFFAGLLWPPHVFLLQASFIRTALSEHCLFSTTAVLDKIIFCYQILVVSSWASCTCEQSVKTQNNSLLGQLQHLNWILNYSLRSLFLSALPFLSLFINDIWKLSL